MKWLLALASAASAARVGGDPMGYLHGRPDPRDDEKIRARIAAYEAEKARVAAGGQPATTEASGAIVAEPRRSGGRALLKWSAVGISVVSGQVGLGVGSYYGVQGLRLRRLRALVRAEQSELPGCSITLPAHPGHLRGQITAHQQLLRQLADAKVAAAAEAAAAAERKNTLVAQVAAACSQLQKPPPPSLAARSEAELLELNGTLARRVEASVGMLDAYLALGQQPPDDFRAWDATRLEARRANVTANAAALREVLLLQAQLGGARKMDCSLAELEPARLQAKVAALREEVEAVQARRSKEALLGKVEAALWLRKQEVPVGLPSMSVEDLHDLLRRLEGKAESQKDA